MRRFAFAGIWLAIFAAMVVIGTDVSAVGDGHPLSCAAESSPPAAAIPRDYSNAEAMERQNKISQAFNPSAETILLGDSLVHAWPGPELRQVIPTGKILNMGVGGSMTQNLLWQLSSDQMKTVSPKRVLVWIGTNNILVGRDTPCHIATAYEAIASRIRELWPDAAVYALGIFPAKSRFRDEDRMLVNDQIRQIAQEKHFMYVNLDAAARCPEEGECDLYVKDGIHLTPSGYQSVGRSLRASIQD